jgi:hypothetical protein
MLQKIFVGEFDIGQGLNILMDADASIFLSYAAIVHQNIDFGNMSELTKLPF